MRKLAMIRDGKYVHMGSIFAIPLKGDVEKMCYAQRWKNTFTHMNFPALRARPSCTRTVDHDIPILLQIVNNFMSRKNPENIFLILASGIEGLNDSFTTERRPRALFEDSATTAKSPTFIRPCRASQSNTRNHPYSHPSPMGRGCPGDS